MPAATTIIAATALAASLATTGYAISESKAQQKEAMDKASEQKGERDKLLKMQTDRAEQEKVRADEAARYAALRKQKRQEGKSDTILTQPLGSQAIPQLANKTLLGS